MNRVLRRLEFRCGQSKTSKLVTIYNDDWAKRLCNGCYGELLSIYDIKKGQQDVNEKVEHLSKILLELVDENKTIEQTKRIVIRQNQARYLSKVSLKFFATSECVANTLMNEPSLDWSPAIIGICKAFEVEIIERLVNPLKQLCIGIEIPATDLKDEDFGRIARFCAGKDDKLPELGAIKHFMSTVANSKVRIETSEFLKNGLKRFMLRRPKSGWLFDKKGMIASLSIITKDFRNKAAHTDELAKKDYEMCRELIFGDKGIMWELIAHK